jgi:hypothetical protein
MSKAGCHKMTARRESEIIVVLSVAVCVVIGLFLIWKVAENIAPTAAQPNPPDIGVFAKDLATEGWVFTPVDPKNPNSSGITQKVITKDRAISDANSNYKDIQKSPGLTAIVAYLGLMSNSGLQAADRAGIKVDPTFLKPHLVWIVSYKGIQEQSSGPPGSPIHFSNELEVVIDAETGEHLMDFVWTR